MASLASACFPFEVLMGCPISSGGHNSNKFSLATPSLILKSEVNDEIDLDEETTVYDTISGKEGVSAAFFAETEN